MHRKLVVFGLCTALLPCLALAGNPGAPATGQPAQTQTLSKEEMSKAFYALGLSIAQSLGGFDLSQEELTSVVEGLQDGVLGKPSDVKIQDYQAKLIELRRTRMARVAEREKAASDAFVAKMAKQPGVEVSESGLIYEELTAGDGPSPKATDRVKVNYVGTLRDGTVFDSSQAHGKPAEFRVSGVIPCWTETLQKMHVGGKAKIVCPASIAYGDRGHPPTIPGGAALVFEVELLSIE